VRWGALLAIAVASCGRVGFEPRGDGGATVDDTSGEAAGIQPIHRYRFAGNLADDFGGPDAVSLGGTLGTAASPGYMFGANQGVSITGALPASVYTVDIAMQFTDVANWQKILDFKALGDDTGFYVFEGGLQFVIAQGTDFITTAATITPSVEFRATLTRDAGGRVSAYLGHATTAAERSGDPAPLASPSGTFTFLDTTEQAVLAGTTASFAVDDAATTMLEAAPGTLREIVIYDVALDAAQISSLP
jgi:hypothetical protein